MLTLLSKLTNKTPKKTTCALVWQMKKVAHTMIFSNNLCATIGQVYSLQLKCFGVSNCPVCFVFYASKGYIGIVYITWLDFIVASVANVSRLRLAESVLTPMPPNGG